MGFSLLADWAGKCIFEIDPAALEKSLGELDRDVPVVTLESPLEGADLSVVVTNAEMGASLAQAALEDWKGGTVLLLDTAPHCTAVAQRLAAGDILMAMGNSDVPVGQYTQKIFAYYGLDEAAIADCLTYGSNVKEVTTQVSEGAVDCGIIYATDAFSAGLATVDGATAEMCGQVIYPAAVVASSQHPDEAQAFLDYLTTDEAGKVFESVGFTTLA